MITQSGGALHDKIGNNNWNFANKEGNQITALLARHDKTPIIRHVKVKGTASPYDGNLKYWSTRMGKHPEMHNIYSVINVFENHCDER